MEKIKAFYEENTSLVLGLAGVVVFIIVTVLVSSFFSSKPSDKVEDKIVGENENTEVVQPVSVVSKPKAIVAAPKMSYSDALLKYKDSTIQFSNSCDVLTFKHVYKNGTEIMIDNRGTEKMFKVGENQMTIKGYDFAIVKLESATLPKVIAIDCGSKQNVSEITIQK